MALTINRQSTDVVGTKYQITGEITMSTTASYFSPGLARVDTCVISSEGTVGGNSDVQVILNSNDGTEGTSDGDVWVDAGAAADGTFIAIGV